MSEILTLKEMASRLKRCEKTFSKYVRLYGIPHIKLGRDMLFNPDEVEQFLKVQVVDTPTPKLKPSPGKPYNKDSERYAKLLELT